jgi:hypothetical protein
MGIVSNKQQFLAGIKECPAEFKRRFSKKVRDVCLTLHIEITERTPVWEGGTLANYYWTVGEPYSGAPIEPPGTGPTGRTNSMPLGVEPRRPESQEVADSTFDRLSFTNPFQVYWLANNEPTVGPLEDGEWPDPPLRQRSPQGMFAVSLEYVVAKLETGGL